jgi:hypothetical protein
MNKKLLSLCSMILITSLTACSTFSHKTKYKFPSEIESRCYGAMNSAKSIVESKGYKTSNDANIEVIKVKGTKKFSGYWAFYEESNNQYCLGYCTGNAIYIAADPSNNEIQDNVLTHEFGHYWLMNNDAGQSHLSVFASSFFNWRDAKSIKYPYPNTTNTTNAIEEIMGCGNE